MIKYVSIDKSHNIRFGEDESLPDGDLIWVDLYQPTEQEKQRVERWLGIELFTPQESEEIESSSRYLELEDEVGINLGFLYFEEGRYVNKPISFILKGNLLITQRHEDHKSFTDVHHKLKLVKPAGGISVFMSILEARIDFDADLIESITDRTTQIARRLVADNDLDSDRLLGITALQESTIVIRENIVEKQRILSAILKSKFFSRKNHETLQVMIKDVGSLLDYTNFNFERLEFSQNTFLGLVNMEQNRIIKIFTVVTVIFMPPTLIASIYGMNFRFMPELGRVWGYPMAIAFMGFSSAVILLFFRRKKWL